jgi:membrane-associated protein
VNDVSDLLLTGLLNYGYGLLGGTLFFAALGVPLPATMLLIAAGAFARQGLLTLDVVAAVALAVSVAGDGCSYLIGRFGMTLMPARLRSAPSWQQAAAQFERWGGWSVFFSRFLFTPIALPINLLAGSTRYPWARYMTAVLLGEVAWVLLFAGLGHVFADRWEVLSQLAQDLSGVLLGALLIVVGLGVFAVRYRRTPG